MLKSIGKFQVDLEMYQLSLSGVSTNPLMERGSSAVECRTCNQGSPGSNPPLLLFRRLGIFVLSIDALVDSAV